MVPHRSRLKGGLVGTTADLELRSNAIPFSLSWINSKKQDPTSKESISPHFTCLSIHIPPALHHGLYSTPKGWFFPVIVGLPILSISLPVSPVRDHTSGNAGRNKWMSHRGTKRKVHAVFLRKLPVWSLRPNVHNSGKMQENSCY